MNFHVNGIIVVKLLSTDYLAFIIIIILFNIYNLTDIGYIGTMHIIGLLTVTLLVKWHV